MNESPRFLLPDFTKIEIAFGNPSDPYAYYQRPLVGWFFINRIQQGFSLLDRIGEEDRVLEVGYGSGILLPTLCSHSKHVYGLDMHDEKDKALRVLGTRFPDSRPTLVRGDVRKMEFTSAFFDLVIGFSIFEHMEKLDEALGEIHRILKPGGVLLAGIPRVDRFMETLFHLIGFHEIHHHHFSNVADLLAAAGRAGFSMKRRARFPLPVLPLYHNLLFVKPECPGR